jgi:hypothetical protein
MICLTNVTLLLYESEPVNEKAGNGFGLIGKK